MLQQIPSRLMSPAELWLWGFRNAAKALQDFWDPATGRYIGTPFMSLAAPRHQGTGALQND